MFDSYVVSTENQFPQMWVPDREPPISNQICEAVRTPSVKSSRNNGDISSIISQVTAELTDKFVSIVEPSVPGYYLSACRQVGLSFDVGFPCRVERPIKHSDGSVDIACVAVWALLGE